MIVLLSFVAFVSAVITIWAKVRENHGLQYIFKPLTMLAIMAIAFLNSSAPMSFYQKAILIGLIFSTVGDVFLIDQKRFFVHGLLSFLLGHFCYIAALWTAPNLSIGIFYLLYIAFFLAVLWRNLGRLKIPVVVYAFTLAAMSWMALSRYLESNDGKNWFAFLGSVAFLASDSLLAYNKFKKPFALAQPFILSTYFAAQWLIALSI